MSVTRSVILISMVLASAADIFGQTTADSQGMDTANVSTSEKPFYRYRPSYFTIPAVALICYLGSDNNWINGINSETRNRLHKEVGHPVHADNFALLTPMAAMYTLNLCGVSGRHAPADQTIILGTAALLMLSTVNTMKYTLRTKRPDGSAFDSFPSGHTATAFMGAHILAREYGGYSSWIAITGYTVAVGVGFFRIYNKRHWLSDVVAGAGIGMLSVEMSYSLYPRIVRRFFQSRANRNPLLAPYFDTRNKTVGVTISCGL